MKGYETICILTPSLTDEQVQETIAGYSALIAANGGAVTKAESWGLKKLAFKVKKQLKGYILFFLYTGNRATVSELERNIKISEQAMRFLTVSVDSVEDAAQVRPNLLEDPILGTAPDYY